MKNWMIRHWLFNYDSKVFGTTFRHLRVVNTLVPLFLFAGLFNLFTEGFGIWDILAFVPFFVVFFGRSVIIGDWNVSDLDWEQQFQLSQQDNNPNPQLYDRWIIKYKGGGENFVEAMRFFLPLVWIVVAVAIYWIFGAAEEGFYEQRFF